MARTQESKQSKSEAAKEAPAIAEPEETNTAVAATNGNEPQEADAEASGEQTGETQELLPTSDDVDEVLNALKTLLSTVEKLQKARQEVGDIKPLLIQMLDGEMMSGEDLDQLKGGINGLFKLVRSYSDYQAALTKAQPARSLLDQVLKSPNASK